MRPLILLALLLSGTAWASQTPDPPSSPAPSAHNYTEGISEVTLDTARGAVTVDYQTIPIPGHQSIDWMGLHYLHQIKPWLYLGAGFNAPLVKGIYGGTMAFDLTFHAQKKIYGNIFVDAGLSLGGGGGGTSQEQSKELSGYGGYSKRYVGFGYDFGSFLAGVNYAHVGFTNSLINHSQLNFYLQKPLSFSLGSYADSGKRIPPDHNNTEDRETILAMELNNLFQIDPKGSNKNNIHDIALEYSHFLNKTEYLFINAELGYAGLGLYNQLLGGIGSRISLSPKWRLYGQIGVGSGGWAPDVIDTGPGLLVYPKLSAEYQLNKHIGLALSGGYLFAPKGSSKNVTMGIALNYHLSPGQKDDPESVLGVDRTLQGFRYNIFHQTLYDFNFGGKKYNNIKMLTSQIDIDLNSNWYIPLSVSAAYTAAGGYPGYVELFTGLGRNRLFTLTKNVNSYAQLTVGTNTLTLFRPAMGLSFDLNDKISLYGQIARTVSLDKYKKTKGLKDYSIGIGLSYRFSVPN